MENEAEDEVKMLTPREFWEVAATWGSFNNSGDPGACMYGFDEKGLVQSEKHRQDCIAYIEKDCRAAAEANIAAGEDASEQYGEIESMLAYLKTAPVEGSMPALDAFTEAYVTAALWITNDESDAQGGDPLDDNYSPEHIAAPTLARIIADCAHFQELYGHLLVEENLAKSTSWSAEAQAGHDFWLTRNRHGAGFWDGDWEKAPGEILDNASESFGEYHLYLGDDGRIYDEGGVLNPKPVAGASAPATRQP